VKREFFRFALAFFGRGVPTHRIKAWCKRLCCATVSRLIGHSLTLQFKLNSRVYIQSVSQSLSPLLGRRLKKSRHARPSDLATLFVQCRASKRLSSAHELNWTTKWRSKSAAPRRRRNCVAQSRTDNTATIWDRPLRRCVNLPRRRLLRSALTDALLRLSGTYYR